MRSAQVPAVQPGLGGSAVAESADRHQERIAGKTSPRTSWASARASVPVSGARGSRDGTDAPSPAPRPSTAWTKDMPRSPSWASSDWADGGNTGTGRATTSGQFSCGRGTVSDETPAKLRASASRAVSGAPRSHRSRIVESSDVERYSSVTIVRSGIQAEIATVGIRTPERSKLKPNWPGPDPSGGTAAGGGTWS